MTLAVASACGAISPQAWSMTKEAALRYGLEPEMLAAVVWVESRYCEDALSKKGAVGLGQLMPNTARELGVDPTIPEQNLDGAARYLTQQWRTFGRWDLALAAYNAGSNRLIESFDMGKPLPQETQDYVPAVLGQYRAFKQQTTEAVLTTSSQPQGLVLASALTPVDGAAALPVLEPLASTPDPNQATLPAPTSAVAAPPVSASAGLSVATELPRFAPRLVVFPERSTLGRRLSQ